MPLDLDADVIVVGAGAAGLAAGLALVDAGRDVLVLEGAPEAGGNLRGLAVDGATLALGPQAFPRSAAHAWWLIERAGLLERVTAPAHGAARFIFRNGRLHRLPEGPLGFACTRVLSMRGKLRMLAEPWQSARGAEAGESVRRFLSRRLGSEAVDALAAPFVTGIHAADPDALEAESAFPSLVRWEREHGSLLAGAFARPRARPRALLPVDLPRASLYSVRGGLSALARGCAAALGMHLRVGTKTLEVHRDVDGTAGRSVWRVVSDTQALRCRHLILAVPPRHAAALLAGVSAEAARLVAAIPMAPVGVIHLGGRLAPRDSARAPGGFGVLVARGEGLRSLGTVFTSRLFPDVAPEGAWLQATYVGGALDPAALDEEDDTLRDLVAAETRRILGIDPDRGLACVIRHPAGIPQMTRGHGARIAALRAEIGRMGSLCVAGNWLDGIGLDAAIASGRLAAEEAEASRRAA